MTCQDAIALLADFLEGELSSEFLRDLEEHLSGCPACRAYLATYRKARAMAADASRIEMPEEMKTRLREFLIARLREER